MSATNQTFEPVSENPQGPLINPIVTKPKAFAYDRTCPLCFMNKTNILHEYSGFICRCPNCKNVFAAKKVRLYKPKDAGNYGFRSLTGQ